ncbi:MAG: inorganic phosphate transporter [Anaerolineae bacterium]|jgi:PiT family inorganic phosphate transporter|nr:inorganic phosphate transporter [Anaerolineae bacterium]MBT3711755.1 inorganic phosphate transporter [Anaerolineae bacterium]MBT4311269.1 inorganic phosphate transporter [Anaerolineae bacterium]MBT4457116.1 inorganic phosphate transporter [Anaerolineae bacterium]MBT4841799.1 inorganic phosphate transporter [Anaerolineae bacterium]
MMTPVLIVMIVFAVIFDFLNGIHDSSNIVATMIASRAFKPRVALGITAVAHFIAPFIFGVAVATTIGHEVVAAEAITVNVLIAALASAIVWNLLTWFLGIPSSSSHALIGGMIGAVSIGAGVSAIELAGMNKILIALFISPVIGLLLGYIFTKLVFFLARGATPKINSFFRRSQIVSAVALSLSHGTNDAQKTMGIITLGLVVAGVIPSFEVPLWVITVSAAAIALGTAMGGWKLIKTLGSKFYKIRPVHGFSSQLTSAFVILGASIVGGPVSTTQVVSSSIMGVGSADRVKMVRWGVAKEIMVAWLVTIPATAALAAGIFWIMEKIL